jgi:hypothetical protein
LTCNELLAKGFASYPAKWRSRSTVKLVRDFRKLSIQVPWEDKPVELNEIDGFRTVGRMIAIKPELLGSERFRKELFIAGISGAKKLDEIFEQVVPGDSRAEVSFLNGGEHPQCEVKCRDGTFLVYCYHDFGITPMARLCDSKYANHLSTTQWCHEWDGRYNIKSLPVDTPPNNL